jgi:hypothetical protein
MLQRFSLALGLLGTATGAHASARRSTALFDLSSERPTPEVRQAIVEVERDCTYSEFSRIGPRPAEVARCNRAEAKAVALGTPAARWALARTDAGAGIFQNQRLYDIAARVGDLSLAELLVHGLEKLATLSDSERAGEEHSLAATLRALTYAELTGTDPATWRAWLDAHRGLSRTQLLAERVAAARAQLAGDKPHAIIAARFLAAEPTTRTDGAAALQTVLGRADLTEVERRGLQRKLDSLPKTPAPLVANQAPRS